MGLAGPSFNSGIPTAGRSGQASLKRVRTAQQPPLLPLSGIISPRYPIGWQLALCRS